MIDDKGVSGSVEGGGGFSISLLLPLFLQLDKMPKNTEKSRFAFSKRRPLAL